MTHWEYSSQPPEKEVELVGLVFPTTWRESSSASPERSDSKRHIVLCDLDGTTSWRKPNPGMILHALEVLGVPPSPDVFYVGDEGKASKSPKTPGFRGLG